MRARPVNPSALARRVLVVAVVLAVPGAASAPFDQYRPFNLNSTEITDDHTKLVWDRPSTDEPYPAAVEYSDAVTACKGGRRLPTVKELLTIVDEEPHREYFDDVDRTEVRYIDFAAFRAAPAGAFWTSSIAKNGQVYTVDFQEGTVSLSKADTLTRGFVRCVR